MHLQVFVKLKPDNMLKLAVLLLFWININVIICEYVTIPELGTIKGSTILSTWTNKTIYQFLGIPFAESPVDELRFKVENNNFLSLSLPKMMGNQKKMQYNK